MAFQNTSRNITIHSGVLKAECRDWDGNYKQSSLDLDQYIGNSDGTFTITKAGFVESASDISIHGAVLSANLKTLSGKWNDVAFNLNLCVANMNGNLEFEKPNESLLNTGSCYSLSGSLLEGLCMGYDGFFYLSQLDLNNYYGNDNGTFKSGDNHFYYSSRNVHIQPSSSSLLLKAELKGNHWLSGDFWEATETDLVTCIVIRGGKFIFEKHDGPFDREGAFTKFFERVPFVGFIVAGIHALAGNAEHAKRALALCANSSIVCGGILIGAFLGGPLGGAIGAAITTPLAILVETKISGKIKDPQLQAQFEEATLGRYIYETLRNVLAAGGAGGAASAVGAGATRYLAKFLGEQVVTQELLGQIASQFGVKLVEAISEFAVYALLKKLIDALKNGATPLEWNEVEEKVKRL